MTLTCLLLVAVISVVATSIHSTSAAVSPQPHPNTVASARPKPAQSDSVDPAVCANCHAEIAKEYQATGMGRSFSRANIDHSTEDFTDKNSVYNEPSDMHYTMIKRDGKFFERRYQTGFREEQTNIVDEQVDYVIGSGNHAQTFLHRDSTGRLIELPVSWYTEGSGYWAMSPGYDRRDQQDFKRAIPAGCMFCHNGYPQGNTASLDVDDPPSFGKALPQGIDCQRCHGPGRAHVAAVLSGAGSDAIKHAIVNPARLSRVRQLDVCMECHLETSSSHTPNQIRRYDKGTFSYRPGQPLGDYMLYFDQISEDKNNDRFEIAHAAYRLRKSACFRNSQMTCLTCHDPHKSYSAPGAMEHYVQVCQSCHQTVAHTVTLPAESTCISCHMPKRRTDDAVHVIMTDHYIQRVKPDRDLLAPLSESSALEANTEGVALYYPPELPPSPQTELYLGLAEAKDKSTSESGVEHLQKAIVKYAPAEPEFDYELGHAYADLGNRAAAIRWFQEALRKKHDYSAAAKELAVALLAEGQAARAAEILQQAIAASPTDDQLLANLGNVYLRLGQAAKARQVLERTLSANPDLPQAENLLGLVDIRDGNQAAAEQCFRNAIRSDPTLVEAHNNLANLLAGTRNYEEAAYHLKKAISIDSGYADAHHSYGLVLELMHSYDQALAELQNAANLDSGNAQAHIDLADLLAVRGQLDQAGDEYQKAIQLKPDSAEARSSLGSILAAQGKTAEAKQQFQKAIALDPNLYEAQLGIAMIETKEGKAAEARSHAQKASNSLDPAIRQAAENLLRALP